MPSADDAKREAIRRSALWAAYGDALGFITEFADSAGVARRAGMRELSTTVPWRRRVGGQFGVQAELPAGAISDDTQLRLATCRAMLPDGTFDVEAFSKVELTVWPAYALGAGRGSRAAATNLTRRDSTWASNFFSGRGIEYVEGGGNGAAMRVQPHVWAAGERPLRDVLHDVLANAICTHGHARGFLGALFHACCLHLALTEGRPAEPSDWRSIVGDFGTAAELLRSDATVHDLWVGPWERRSGRRLEDGIDEVAREMLEDIDRLSTVRPSHGVGGLRTAIEELGVYSSEQRGSGTKTALLAGVAAWIFAGDPRAGVLACANALGTDTDTVATMAGALLGVLASTDPDGAVQDSDYVVREAERMWAIGTGRPAPSFPFVDLLAWVPPRSQSDVAGLQDGTLALAGLGPADAYGPTWEAQGRDAVEYGWVRLWFGQSILPKRRLALPDLPQQAAVRPSLDYVTASLTDPPPRPLTASKRASGDDTEQARHSHRTPSPRQPVSRASGKPRTSLREVSVAPSMHVLTDIVIRSGFNPEVVGAGLLKAIDGDGSDRGVERGLAYVSIIAKARLARRATDNG